MFGRSLRVLEEALEAGYPAALQLPSPQAGPQGRPESLGWAMQQLRIDRDQSLHEIVVAAAARTYELTGEAALLGESLNGAIAPAIGDASPPDLYLPGLLRIEEVETERSLEHIDLDRLRRLRGLGLEIWVLVPLPKAGRAQTLLSGVADKLQPWWTDETGIRFGSPRLI